MLIPGTGDLESRKRMHSPDNIMASTRKPIKRTRAYNIPLNNELEGDSGHQNWSTLDTSKIIKKPINKDVTQTPKFRMPSNYFALQNNAYSGFKTNTASTSSSASARANWFRPSLPGAVNGNKKTEGYSTVTSRGVQPARNKNNNNKNNNSRTRPTFVTESTKNRNDQEKFHAQLRASVGISGQAESILRDITGKGAESAGQPQDCNDQDDWKSAWRTAAKPSVRPSGPLSKFAHGGVSSEPGKAIAL